MVKINGYTIQQISDLAGVSKITMYKFIASGTYTETVGKRNAKLYSETVKNLILTDFKNKKSNTTVSKQETVVNGQNNTYSDDYVSSLKDQIQQLQSFIDHQSEQLTAVQKSLDQAQQLQLIAEQRLNDEHQKVIELSEFNNTNSAKQTFWSKLFQKLKFS
ncbi:hypothetical protein [Weissella confusa]|uniref:hypothetical protein n=1 Tax=Weissella confusa TaxID=1583 RepID=UPI00107F0669|nr:hypothetical protein [Weissella confusa]MBJ7656519.1 hypothetical protein [Weissella confusa]TGE40295.1 hypothetical protein C6P25_11175 [Weissella confusa]